MNKIDRVELLQERHRKIDTILSTELNSPIYDPLRVQELKKSKLRLKDEISILKKRRTEI